MGGTRWSEDHYHDRKAKLKRLKKSAFEYDEEIRRGERRAGVHSKMDPRNFTNGVRESRDSEAQPNSTPIVVLFDVTGSMRRVPITLQDSLCSLMDLCLRRGFVEDPSILVGGIGDATCDIAPVQIGQFESGNEIENDLANLYLEGGGGGQKTESYELGLYFLARKTVTDRYEKRGKKGYAFLIGDEMPYSVVSRREVKQVFGDDIQADIPLEQILAEAKEKFEIYSILPNLTSYYDDSEVIHCWRDMFGQQSLRLDDPVGISELIASTIGLAEKATTLSDLAGDLQQQGTTSKIARSVAAALDK